MVFSCANASHVTRGRDKLEKHWPSLLASPSESRGRAEQFSFSQRVRSPSRSPALASYAHCTALTQHVSVEDNAVLKNGVIGSDFPITRKSSQSWLPNCKQGSEWVCIRTTMMALRRRQRWEPPG